jgi:ubiquinone/menaquinone biosynthesis C-methylase UbiE
MTPAPPVPRSAAEAAYLAAHVSMIVPVALSQRAVRAVLRRDAPPAPALVRRLEARITELFARDLRNVREGGYPEALLFQFPLRSYLRRVPSLVRDFPRVLSRRRRGAYREVPEGEARNYPPYFRRTFHWQSDGYLSRRSAELYDLGVEWLFGGTADVMRRQVIPPLTRALAGIERPRILDVACGTGRTLSQLHAALPGARLYGLDLSPYYVQAARQLLAHVEDASFVVENAEAMPFQDGTFDAVTSTYLFHELPRNARRAALSEMLRVLKPGGLLVLEDSAQYAESDDVAFFLERFPEDFHEPFYRDYLKDDLAAMAREAGAEVRSVEPIFVAKLLVAQKPLRDHAP